LIGLQRSAGNSAVRRLLTVQRCGGLPPEQCPCHDGDQAASEAAALQGVQRDVASPTLQREQNQSWKAGPAFGAPMSIDEREIEQSVGKIISIMGGTASVVRPYQAPAVASNDSQTDQPTAQTSPIPEVVQRSGGLVSLQRSGGGGAQLEGGVVASAQICYNLCTGEVSLVGWLWAGAGVKVWGNWFGAYYFWEGSRVIGQLDHLQCGVCSPDCGGGAEKHGKESGWGIAGFPVALVPGEWSRFKKLGLEVGLLVTPHSYCDADLELIALFDLLEYVPSFKPPITAAEAAAEAVGIHLQCGLGIDVSGSVHLCKDEQGHATADNAKICAGAFLGCGVGLSHDRGSLPGGQHPVPA
jgi:hypothetical protein